MKFVYEMIWSTAANASVMMLSGQTLVKGRNDQEIDMSVCEMQSPCLLLLLLAG